MKRLIFIAAVMLISIWAVGCKPNSSGGTVLETTFKLIEEKQPPATGTPSDYSPMENLSFAAYNFNHASSWESEYTGTVTAIGTNQKVKNVRKFDGDALLSQAISYSNMKSVAEQKYFKGDKILVRNKRGAIDSANMTTNWSTKVTELSNEEFFRNYGVKPNEIFKFLINESTISKSEPVSASLDGAYAFRFELNNDSAQYIKNEVRTLAGSKSDPEYKSIECTIEVDENWNILRTSGKEVYDLAIFAGVTCTSSYIEEFKLNSPVTITERAIFESGITDDGSEPEVDYGSLDFLTLAFGGLTSGDAIDLKGKIGGIDATINLDLIEGKFVIKADQTIIENNGEYLYILGKQKAKIKLLSLYQSVYNVLSLLPNDSDFSLPIKMPEISALIAEVKAMLGKGEQPEGESESMITRIVNGISDPIDKTENSATVNIDFTLDGINFFVKVTVKDLKLDSLTAKLGFEDKSLDIELSPTTEKIVFDENGAHELSGLVESLGSLTKKEAFSFRCDDMLLTAKRDDGIILNTPSFKLGYNEGAIKLNLGDKNLCFNLNKETSLPELKIADIINAVSSLSASVKLSTEVFDNEVLLTLDISGEPIVVRLSADDASPLKITALGKTFIMTDEVATLDDASYINIDKLASFISKTVSSQRLDLKLKPNVLGLKTDVGMSIDLANKCASLLIGDTHVTISDAIYITNDKLRGKFSFDAIGGNIPSFELPSFTMEYIKDLLSNPPTDLMDTLLTVIQNLTFSAENDLTIRYSGTHGDFQIEASVILGETLSADVDIVYKDITFSAKAEEGDPVAPSDTSNCISLDPILNTLREFSNEMPVFDCNFKAGENDITAYIMPDIKGGGLIATVGNLGLYVYDKMYLSNKVGCFSMTIDSVKTMLGEAGITLPEGEIGEILPDLLSRFDYSVKEEGNKLIAVFDFGSLTLNIYFNNENSFFERAELNGADFTAELTASTLESLPRPTEFDDTPIDSISELINPITNLIKSDILTVEIENLTLKSSNTTISGFVSYKKTTINESEQNLDLALELNIVGDQTHVIKAESENDNVKAYYIYDGKAMQLAITKNELLSIAFKIADIVGIKTDLIEKFRPNSDKLVKSEIIFNALSDSAKDTLAQLNELLGNKFDLQSISLDRLIEYIELMSITASQGELSLSTSGDSLIAVNVKYDSAINSVSFDTDKVGAKIKFATEFTDITDESAPGVDLNGLGNLLESVINTVNLGEYNVNGTIKLLIPISLFIPDIEKDLGFNITAKIVDNKTPYVYTHISVPSVLLTLTRAESYIFFYDGMMYLKSDRYSNSGRYESTVYKKCTPKEFGDNLMENLFFLVPLSDAVQNLIRDSVASSTGESLNYAEALKSFSQNGNDTTIEIDLKKLTGKGTLGDLTVLLNASNGKITNLNINTAVSIAQLGVSARLDDYVGTITYGENTNSKQTDILEMPSVLSDMANAIPEW